ncbi:uncharacterized protein LOC142984292 [Anticarsia gemmatalis]|uniref:uncharacterized protein LOC142984292 n=1 Tax=Anticarsia gemmatalis TaxID=129554 RepID=UPI003F75D542
MKHLILLLGLVITSVSGRRICDACFDGVCHTKSLIFDEYPVVGQLAVDRTENVVYFYYEGRKSTDHTVAFDLDDIRFFTINSQFSFARAVNQASREVYISGTTGIYKYHPVTNVTGFHGLQDKTIWHMQFKHKLYYTILSTKGLYAFEKKQSKSITALNDYHIDDFIIDRNDDIYFMSNFTVYKLKKGDKKPTLFSNTGYYLSTDIYDNAYFVLRESSGLYKIDERSGRLTEVGTFGGGSPFKTVFDKFNNIIYFDSNTNELNYLVPNHARCRIRSAGAGRKLKKILSYDSEVTAKHPIVAVSDSD